MESTMWLRIVVVLVLLIGSAGALMQWAMSCPDDDWKGLTLNLVTELIGAALTYVLFELVIERTQEREAEKKELAAKKADLIAQMGSSVKDVAIAATEELRRHGWLYDGSLRRAVLARANLQGADLSSARLQEATLEDANLQGACPDGAYLQDAHLEGANLQGATLVMAKLLQEAYFDYSTRLPDGTQWTLDTDVTRFTDIKHPDFWYPWAK